MSKFRKLRPGEPEFTLVDGLMIWQRANIEIRPGCPQEYVKIIFECYRQGWLQPVATVYEHELTFATLKN